MVFLVNLIIGDAFQAHRFSNFSKYSLGKLMVSEACEALKIFRKIRKTMLPPRLAFWLSGSLAFWLSGSLALWLSGSLALWLSGSLALWLSQENLRKTYRSRHLHTC